MQRLSSTKYTYSPWWRHLMETCSALLALCVGNSPVTGEFPSQRPVTQSFDVSFDLCLNKRLSKQSWWWWFETPSRPFWRHWNDEGWSLAQQVVNIIMINWGKQFAWLSRGVGIRSRFIFQYLEKQLHVGFGAWHYLSRIVLSYLTEAVSIYYPNYHPSLFPVSSCVEGW